jgi:2-polyprenyl-3-methyl-5-hydroxy-6-metoxy-1,4-benzoquinol methylase
MTYKEYGYDEFSPTDAHSHLLPSLISLLTENNKKILDVGCGNGWIADALIRKGYYVYGTDASEEGVFLANKKNSGHFFVQDLNTDELPKEIQNIKFDTIISTEVVEHLYDPRSYVRFIKQILLKNGGGEIIISTPYHGYLKNVVLSVSGQMDRHFTTLWDGGHIKFWSRKSLTALLQEQGFTVTQFKGSGRMPYLWKSMLIKAQI